MMRKENGLNEEIGDNPLFSPFCGTKMELWPPRPT
jgi:hypothetical protein